MASGRGAIEKLILLGDKGASARHVPEARHKAIEYAKQLLPGAFLSKKLLFRDGWAAIQVTNGRRRIIIYTEAGEATYEFFTSELIASNVTGTPPHIGTGGYNVSVCGKGSFHKIRKKATESTPLVNLCSGCTDTLPGNDPESPIPLEDCNTNEGLIYMTTTEAWDYKKAQVQVWWSNNQGSEFVICQSDVDSYYSRRCLQARYNGSFIYRATEFYSDGSYYPVAFRDNEPEPFAYGSPNMPAGRKRRKACIVNSEGFKIMVMVDNKGTFYAWEAGAYDNPGDIPRVDTVTPAYNVLIEDGLGTFNFNSNGSKAVAVGIERVQTPLEDGIDVVYKATIGQLEGHDWGLGRDNASTPYGTHLAKEDRPHLVEVTITVGKDTLTGEWTFDVVVSLSERQADTGKWFVAADYLIGDKRLPYPKDTLVVMTAEAQYDTSMPNGLFLTPGGYFPDDVNAVIDTALATEAYIKIESVWTWVQIEHYPMYGNVFVYPGVTIPYTDPFGNTGETWVAGQKDEPTEFRTLHARTIRAMNLRTLSFLFLNEVILNHTLSTSNNARSYQTQVIAYNEEVEKREVIDPSQGIPSFEFAWPTANRAPIPSSYLALLSIFAENLYQVEWLNQFNWHPKGHWSINHYNYPVPSLSVNNWQVDIVNTRIGGKDIRTTHKDLYNAAFGDNRDDSYYNDNTHYRGVFRTAGLWRDQ